MDSSFKSLLYLEFVVERHKVWERRQGLHGDWSDDNLWSLDPVLNANKFTNVFRVLDYGSQFVIKHLVHGEEEYRTFQDELIRCFLYRYTNRPEPWEFFRQEEGAFPYVEDIQSGLLLKVWNEYKAAGNPIFGNAYKMFVGGENKGMDRLTWAVNLARNYITAEFAGEFYETRTMRERHELLKTLPRCADFMAMQVLSDIGWSRMIQANEDEFVVPGPGCIRGAREIAPDSDPAKTIRWAQNELRGLDDCPTLRTSSGGVHTPSLMDVQNTLCEFSKYVRYVVRLDDGRNRVYRPKHPGVQPKPFLPPHW